MGVAHLWPKLATAVADEARRIGLAGGGLWAPLSNEASEWDSGMGNGERGRQHKIKAFRKLKASVALTPLLPHPPPTAGTTLLPPLATAVSQFSIFGLARGSGLPADFGPLPHFKDTLMHFINLGYGYKTVATHVCVCECV